MIDEIAPGFFVLAALGAALAYFGVFYQTGDQWFQSCWPAQHANRAPTSPEESIAWAQCSEVTQRALFNSGFIFAGNPEHAVTPELKAVVSACPSNYSDIPLGGAHILAVDFIEKDGGPRLFDKFTPPDQMIVRVFKSRWPNCQAVRLANNIPKLVKQGEGWGFESPCKPCEAEKKAMGL